SPHLQPRVLHMGRATRHAAGRVRSATIGQLLEGVAPLPRHVGRAHHRVQRASDGPLVSSGFRCPVCGTFVPIETPWPWRCPRATATDRAHVLRIEPFVPAEGADEPHLNPFVDHRRRMAWYQFAISHGYDDAAAVSLAEEVDEAVRDVAGVGFAATMVGRSAGLSEALGLDIWVKDETGNVGGSHKGRHLTTILLHLLAAERTDTAPGGGH